MPIFGGVVVSANVNILKFSQEIIPVHPKQAIFFKAVDPTKIFDPLCP